jgi:uncharacterized protein
MDISNQKIRFFRNRIPIFMCEPGCHDCCGPVTASTYEMAQLPVKTEEEHHVALENFSCPHLGEKGCMVYTERPLICRLFGTTPRLACPRGNRPVVTIDPIIEQGIYQFFKETRHVLV